MSTSAFFDPELVSALQLAREAQQAVQAVLRDLAQRAAVSAAAGLAGAAATPTALPAPAAPAVHVPRKASYERTAVMNPGAVAEMVARARSAATAKTAEAATESAVRRAHRVLAGMWMAYQPVVSARAQTPVAYEALSRTVASGVGASFGAIQAVQDAGMLATFSRAVRTQVAAALATHDGVHTMFVNIEEADLDDAMLGSGSDPLTVHANRVVFDVSLSRFKSRVAGYRRRIERLQARGFRFALDDFGVATVGLQSLDELRPQFVKIGIHATENLDSDPRKQAVLATIVRACAGRGTTVIAKAIERKSEFNAAASLGVPWMSGWYCGRAEAAPA